MSTSTGRHAPPSLPLPHRINRMPSVNELVGARSMQSPLTQLRVGVEANLPRTRSSPVNTSLASTSTAPPLPPIDFNLFRTASVYSVDSVSSMSTVTTDDDDVGPSYSNTPSALARPESPTTPKASQTQGRGDYFDGHAQNHGQSHAGPSRAGSLRGGPATPNLKPKSSFVVRSRKDHEQIPPVSPSHLSAPSTQARTINRPRAQSRPEPPTHSHSQIRAAPAHHQPDQEEDVPDHASVYGEQGSDWGDDEQQFEWVDTLNAPEEKNGTNKIQGLSPSKRLSRLKAAVVPSTNDGRKLRKQLTFARRAPPPPLDKPSAPPPMFMEDGSATTPTSSSRPTVQRGLSRSVRYHAIPLRPSNAQPTVDARPPAERSHSDPPSLVAAGGQNNQVPAPNPPTRKPPPPPMQLVPRPTQLAPNMVPLKGDSATPTKRNLLRNSQMSFQSVAYSLYDLDGLEGDLASPLPGQGIENDLALKGRYTKIKASALESDVDKRTRKISERSTGSGSTIGAANVKTPEEFVAAGIEARGKGDLAKSAWYFMRATELGSLTGKMYYGLALRHGWGITKDEKKAFHLLRQACDETLASTQGQSSLDIQQSRGTVKLSLAQKKEMTRDLSLGLFEIANCFLEGSGTKKSPEVALEYLKLAANMGDLASQEQLGFLLSKGGSGVKKDMKEASRWYRMAISSGSSNTIGLAWVWKEKYMV